MEYGGFWIRFAAYLIDAIILGIAQFIIFSVLGVAAFGSTSTDIADSDIFATTMGTVAYFITLAMGVLYFVLMESSAKQATLGKMALGLVVTDMNGQRISWLRALGRYFAKILSGLIMAIGFIMIAFTDNKQGLHDMICSTLVVKGRPGEVGVDPSVFS